MRLGVLLSLVGSLALARDPREVGRVPVPVSNGTSTYNCESGIAFSAGSLTVTPQCTVDLNTQVTKAGSCVGDVIGELCGSLGEFADGAFKYAGEGAATGTCSGTCSNNSGRTCVADADCTVCQGGTVSGSLPTGTCTLTSNSMLLRNNADAGATGFSVVRSYTSLSLTAGTLACPATIGQHGIVVSLRVRDDVTISGSSTVSCRGKGARGQTFSNSTCRNNAAGGGSSSSDVLLGITGAAAGANNGGAGTSITDPIVYPYFFSNMVGGGGGGGPGTTVGVNASHGGLLLWDPVVGAIGGAGAGCPTSCTGTIGNAGIGGPHLRIEVGGAYSCSSATIDVRGADGGASSGGGAGGAVELMLRQAATVDSCIYSVTGGAGGAKNGNCGNGGAGGNGLKITRVGVL